MANFRFVDMRNNLSFELDFGDFIELVKGSSIKSLAAGDDFIEFGTSDSLNIRIDDGAFVSVFSTVNDGDNPPLRLRLIDTDESPTAKQVEDRIHALRQMYAVNFLLDNNRFDAVNQALIKQENFDAESLLKDDDKLRITAAGAGSFWITVATKSAAAFKSLSGIAPLFFSEGRQAVLERARANTDLRKLDVEKRG